MTSPAEDCLERTRSAVLNVLIAVGTGIALSGWLLRWRDRWSTFRAPGVVGQGLLAGLLVLGVASYAVRRSAPARGASGDWGRWASRYYRSHVLAASLGALAVPLGLAYGWLVRPQLRGVAPFWIAALALGCLAFPRAHELDTREPGPGASQPVP